MKEELLRLLKDTYPDYLSGEELSTRFSVSRTAVWKWINQLKELGYTIESQTNKGYRLAGVPDSLHGYELRPLLETELIGRNIIYFDSIDSTNMYIKREADAGLEDGTVVIADEQTAGRGRLGRGWVSSRGKGIWMSVLLRPQIDPSDASKLTLAAACAVCRGIRTVCGLEAAIKWPNDIVIGGKKVCGILTEMNAEMDGINYLVVGIGINANLEADDFGEELKQLATSLRIELGNNIERKYLAAAVINELDKIYGSFVRSGNIADIMPEYRESSAVIGKQVRLLQKGSELIGKAVGINEDGQLIIELEDGTRKEVMSGEVSVRGLYGYI